MLRRCSFGSSEHISPATMASSGQHAETTVSTPIIIPRRSVSYMSCSPLFSRSQQQTMASPSDALKRESSSEHDRAIGFDDDDTFWTGSELASPVVSPFPAAAPVVDPMDFHPAYFATTELFNPNPSVCTKLNPAAPTFEYQLSHTCIQDAAPETDQQGLQLQHPISELSASEFLAESSSAAVPQPHTPQSRPQRLSDMPYHPRNVKKRGRAAMRAQNQERANGGGSTMGPYRTRGSNGSTVATRPSGAPSGSGCSTASDSSNGSSKPLRSQNSWSGSTPSLPSFTASRTRSNRSNTLSSTATRTSSGSFNTPATTDGSPSPPSLRSLSPSYKPEDTAGPSNHMARPATSMPAKEPKMPAATAGEKRTYRQAARPPRSPPASTTGRVGVPAAATGPRQGRARGRTWPKSPPAQTAKNDRVNGQSWRDEARPPT